MDGLRDNFIAWLGIGAVGYLLLSLTLTLIYGHALNKVFKLGGIWGMGRLLIAVVILIFGLIWWGVKRAVGASKDATPRQTVEKGIQNASRFKGWVDDQWSRGKGEQQQKIDEKEDKTP